MNTLTIPLLALIDLWDRLPELLGDRWPPLYRQLAPALRRLRDEPAARVELSAQIFGLLRGEEAIRERMRELNRSRDFTGLLGERARGEGDAPEPGAAPSFEDSLDGLRGLTDPPRATMYVDTTAPERLAVGRRGVVTLRLTVAPEAGAPPVSVAVARGRPVDVVLDVDPDRLAIEGDHRRRLVPGGDEDTEPVAFYVRGLAPGRAGAALLLYAQGELLGRVELALQVGADPALSAPDRARREQIASPGPYVPPADLDVLITTHRDGGQTVLSFMLHSANGSLGLTYHKVGAVRISGDLPGYRRDLLRRMEGLAQLRDMDGEVIPRAERAERLAGFGREIWRALVPEELKGWYRRVHDRIETLRLLSEEPWIPWEMARPYDDTDPDAVLDHDFLCMRYEMSRWLIGRSQAAGRIRADAFATVCAANVPGYTRLPHARREVAGVAAAARAMNMAPRSPAPAERRPVLDALEAGGVGLWHFACHGAADLERPGRSSMVLADGKRLRAEDLQGPRATAIRRVRPLVVMNACRVASGSPGLVGLGGWVDAWVSRAGCGALLAPLWSVDDRLARAFAERFYRGVQDGLPLGEAVRAARAHALAEGDGNPLYLAYSLYAHPNAVVRPPAGPGR